MSYRKPAAQLPERRRRAPAISRADEQRVIQRAVDGLQKRIDDWVNTITGLGDPNYDKRLAMEVTDLGRQPDTIYEWLYATDDIAATIVDRIVDDALRGGVQCRIYTADGSQDEEAMKATSARAADLRIVERVTEGTIFGRLKGGAIDVLGVEDGGKPEMPLAIDKATGKPKVRSFRFHHVVDKQSVTIERTYATLLEANYGENELYKVQPEVFNGRSEAAADIATREQLIHASRTILFRGARTSRRRRYESNAGWDDSVLRRPWEVIRDFASVWANAALALHDMSRPVLKIPRLFETMGNPTGAALLEARVKAAQLLSSMSRYMVIDGQESLERDGPDLSGLPDLLDRFMLRLAAAARMPVTILMGRSPAGMNATGESDLQSWYDTVRAYQRDVIKPVLEQLYLFMFLSQDGPTKGVEPERWELGFPALGQPSAKEHAQIQSLVAAADAQWIDRGVLRPEEAALSHFRPEGFSSEYVVDLDQRRRALKENPDPEPGGVPNPDDEEDPPEPPEDDDEEPPSDEDE